jgi:penicillin-binding protein 1C
LLDLTNAYRALANGGLWSPVSWRPDAPRPTARRVFQADAARQVTEILAEGTSRALTFGFDSPLVSRRHAAVKTGTSKDMRDNWCIGYTERYTVGVWVGNASGAAMHAVSGVAGAAPVWRQLVEALSGFSGPVAAHETRMAMVSRDAADQGRQSVPSDHRIGSPMAGSVWLIDPAIPGMAQRILFEGPDGHWWIDGLSLGAGPRLFWAPRPGRHTLELRSRDGVAIDRIAFVVRASTGRSRRAEDLFIGGRE